MATALTATASDNIVSGSCAKIKSSSRRRTALDLASIAPIINAGFRAVLKEATKRGVLDPPHGRTPMPDPNKIIEDDPFASRDGDEDNDSGGQEEKRFDESEPVATEAAQPQRGEDDNNDDDDDDKLLEYKFDYGFNPLVFLGEYLRKNNPEAVRARKAKHDADLAYLRWRVAKCRSREAALVELRDLVVLRQSGIIHGPIVGEVSDCGGIVWARTFRSGQLTIELSRYEDFHTICRQGVMKVHESTECSAVVEFDDLDSGTTWYHRAYLLNPRKGFDGPMAGLFVKGKFSTLPERDESNGAVYVFRIVAFSLRGLGLPSAAAEHRHAIEGACSAIAAAKPWCCLALGGPSTSKGVHASSSMRCSSPESFSDLQETAARIPALMRLLQGNGFLTACSLISQAAGKPDRGKYHHHRDANTAKPRSGTRADAGTTTAALSGSTKTSKPTTLNTKGEAESLEGGVGEGNNESPPLPAWPIRYPEAWGSRPLGPTADLFLIDAREGFLGEDQLAWVAEAVEESGRTWKVIACGVPVGISPGELREASLVEPTQQDEEIARQHAAAATIQAHLRPLFMSKPSATIVNTATITANNNKVRPEAPSGGSAVKETIHPSGVMLDPSVSDGGGGAKDGNDIEGGVAAGEAPEGRSGVNTGTNISRATLQLQSVVSRLHASGCSNVVLVTPARSRPHALSFFSGHEAEGRFPVYELGCSGLVPLLLSSRSNGSNHRNSGNRNRDTNTNTEEPEPYAGLEPRVLLPYPVASLSDGGVGNGVVSGKGTGVACTLSFGRDEGEDDWLSFVVSDAGGENIASLTLPAVT